MKQILNQLVFVCILVVGVNEIYSQSYELRGNLRQWIKVFGHYPHEVDLSESRLKLELLSTLNDNSAIFAKSYSIFDEVNRTGSIRFQEAYIDYYSKYLDVRFGKQIMTWGKADEINPTDILNPQNMTNITEDKIIRKIGLMALKTDWKFYDFVLEGIWKPEFDNTKFPALDSRWAFFSIPGLDSLPEPEYPSHKLKDTEWAFKLSRTIQMFDVSVSYFDGWDNNATSIFKFNSELDVMQLKKMKFYRTKMFGAEFAGSLASIGMWAEGAYFYPEDSDSPWVKNPYYQYVIGCDYTFAFDITVNVQYFQEINETKDDEDMVSKLGFGMPLQQANTFRVEKHFGYGEAQGIELFAIYDIKDKGLLFQPKLTISPDDSFEIALGYIVYAGENESVLGRFEKNDQGYVKGTYSF